MKPERQLLLLMKKRILIPNALVCISVLSHAGLTHRYIFDGDVQDTVGALDAGTTGIATYTELVKYNAGEVPLGAVAGAPTHSVEVGMNHGSTTDGSSKKSGFWLDKSALDRDAGTLSFWFKPDTAKSAYCLNAGLNTGLAGSLCGLLN